MKRLIKSWIDAERERGNNMAAMIRFVNGALGTKLTHSRLSQWKRGVYKPSPQILSLALYRSLPFALRRAGIEASDAQLQKLGELFWLMDEDGVELL